MDSALLHYCQTMSMSYSYKPVLLLALMKKNGKITIAEAAQYFIAFYTSRLERGLVSEKTNSIFCKLDCTTEQIKQNIIANPVRALLNSSRLFKYDPERELLEVDRVIWNSMRTSDVNEVMLACRDRLDRYYSRLLVPRNEAYILFNQPEECNGYLSNNYFAEFVAHGHVFHSMLQYMAYRKALAFGKENTSRQILHLTDPNKLHEVYMGISQEHNLLWDGQQQLIAYHGLIAKFQQNADICHQLLGTGSAVIAACFPDDSVWGIGLPCADMRARSMDHWPGQNLLGFTLMQTRNTMERIFS